MELPLDLQQGLAEELRAVAPARLARAAEALSLRYRSSSAAGGGSLLAGPDDALAYAAHRMPATFAALQAAWRAAQPAMPAPRSLLDVGAGTGAAAWAALAVWPTLSRVTFIERDPAMLALGRRLAARARAAALLNAEWRRQELNAEWSAAPHDLVSAAYLLGELPEPARAGLLERLRALAGGLLLIVEPGTPAGFAVIRAARDQLRAAGAWVVAPCPHQGPCPIAGSDWCHFARRLVRPAAQRRVKAAELGYEDEKFAYVALAPSPGPPVAARVLRHPRYAPGRVELQLCTPAGLQRRIVTKSEGDLYRRARDVHWGDIWPDKTP